jgi:arylsulfatase A-like enzyme
MSLFAAPTGVASRQAVEATPDRPDVVLFYLDDWAPYPARLWAHEGRTPELARFVDHGLAFDNAIASTPLCGPSRANLLTGRYGHDAGVTQNRFGRYDGAEPISTALRGAGYRTSFVGKHLNGLARRYPNRTALDGLADQWDDFDVIWHDQGRFYDWRQYRKTGTHRYGHAPTDHSSFQAAQRAERIIESTPSTEPLFLVVSLVDGHLPRTPMKRFEGDPSCAGIRPWRGPGYQEKDVSDKPAYIRRLVRHDTNGFDLRTRCEESLTIDWVVGRVRRALRSAGRLNDTLQILTADNGVLMGDHRLVGKTYPYDTWVPLYIRWPTVLGNRRREIKEPVANVDLAQTVCELAGCDIPDSDGMSLVKLILGQSDRLDRSFVWSEMLHRGPRDGTFAKARPAWIQIQTTLRYSDRLWSYTLYDTGEEELYDIAHDPHRLVNQVDRPRYRQVRADLRAFLDAIRDADRVRWKARLP